MASAITATVRGHIADPSGALIPGATITVSTSAGKAVATVTADSGGAYSVGGLAPGAYIVKATYQGFSPASSPAIQIAAGQSKRVDISMAIVVEQQSVTVSDDEAPAVNVEASGNTSSIVMKDKDLDALSDDPDELSSELTALAGPSAGPNGGEVYISGFTGGQLPPKSAIREIRINQNPFSSEFDRLGYGRIEILTKPGTDQLHGRFFGQGNDDAFNTGNPFTKAIPAYHSIQYNGTLSGSLSKNASFFISVEERNNQNASIYTANTAVQDPNTLVYSAGNKSGSLFSPSTHTSVSPRIDLQLGQKNTLTLRYQFERFNSSGNIGTTSLPSQSSTSDSTEHTLQVSDSQVINDHLVNETRFQYLRDISSSSPVSTAPTISVPGAFTGGGNSSQRSNDHEDHLELQNLTTMTAGAHALKFGTRLRYNRDANSTTSGFNGTFSFTSVNAYVTMLNGLAAHQTFAQIAAAGGLPNKLNYTTGTAAVLSSVFDGALFVQDDWKANQFLTLSGGLRWESQNHVTDHSDWGPRVAFAYALDGHKDKKQAKTVLRGGYGYFYDRFPLSSLLSTQRFNGGTNSQTQYTITNPTCFDSDSISAFVADPTLCGSASASAKTIVQIAPQYHSPYTQQLGTSLERQLTKTTSLTLTYQHAYGVHQMVTRDSNAYHTGDYIYNLNAQPTILAPRPNSKLGIVEQYDPEGVFKQNQVIVNINARLTPRFSVMGYYNMTYAKSNTGTASNSYNLNQDYRPAAYAARNSVFLMSNYAGPLGITFNPFLIAQAGRPFNVVTPYDLTGDNFFNDRPSISSSSNCTAGSTQYIQTSYGCLNTLPQSGETLLGGNVGTGPASVAVNLRVTRAFGLGPKLASAAGSNNQGGGPSGPPPGGGPGGGGRGGFGGGGFGHGGGGGMMGGSANTGHKYSLSFSAQALNLFNNIDYGQPVGVVTDSRFGKSTSLAGGIFSSGSAARRIFIQTAFSF
ncbi:MAG: carboxypeptidase regulatory-like domain-containing protein [Terracidiphilus sp.]|nr:carboxypeptidase regulatory-like domain-containing protein [Terracidiphilus sp.]